MSELNELLQVGVITQTHGIKGEVKVFPTTDDPKRFNMLEAVFIDTGKEVKRMEIENVKFFKQFVILKFRGCDSINEVEIYKKMPLVIPREQAVPLENDEYFLSDLIGMKVFSENSVFLGVITEVLQNPANDVYVIQTEEEKEVLIPAIKQCVLRVNMEERRMTVHLMEGLID